jgi:acyl-CoA synthetase (AMP-forming)/AMP-acid ligase II
MHPGGSAVGNAKILHAFDCRLAFFHPVFADAVPVIRETAPDIAFIAMDNSTEDVPLLNAWIGETQPVPIGRAADDRGIAMLQPTGGTTGEPKGVMHTNSSLEASILGFVHEDPTLQDSRMLVVAPLTHGAGVWAISGLAAGATVVVQPGFDVLQLLDGIEQHAITSIFLPPTALYAMLDHPQLAKKDLSSLRNILIGAAPVSPDRFIEAIKRFGPILHEVYGQTEALPPVTFKRPADYMRPDGSVDRTVICSAGRQAHNVWVEIIDDDGKPVKDGEIGEIVLRGTGVMLGYYNNPEETARIGAYGWHHTEDIGIRDARGFITVVERKKDMIISGGFNIYPSQVENALNADPRVIASIVVGVPDDRWGEAVKAVVQLKPGEVMTEDEVRGLCRAKLGPVFTPKSVEFWDELPRSAVGKLLRKEIKARYWQSADRKI